MTVYVLFCLTNPAYLRSGLLGFSLCLAYIGSYSPAIHHLQNQDTACLDNNYCIGIKLTLYPGYSHLIY